MNLKLWLPIHELFEHFQLMFYFPVKCSICCLMGLFYISNVLCGRSMRIQRLKNE